MILSEHLFIFPFTVLPGSFYRFISLVLPSVRMLEVIRPVVVPKWNRGEFQPFRVVHHDETRRKIAEIYRGYQDFAKIHGEKYLLETVSLSKDQEEWGESRLRLRSALKTAEAMEVSDEWVKFLESALIIELARDLDQRDIELDADIERVHILDSEFRKTLGLDETYEEGVDESLNVTAEALPRRSFFGYMTSRRIASWLRLYTTGVEGANDDSPILLCITRNIYEEVIDPIRTRYERQGGEWSENDVFSITLENVFERMNEEDFEKLRCGVMEWDRHSFWGALEHFLREPENPKMVKIVEDEVARFSTFLRDRIRAYAAGGGTFGSALELRSLFCQEVTFSKICSAFLGVKSPTTDKWNKPVPLLIIDERMPEAP